MRKEMGWARRNGSPYTTAVIVNTPAPKKARTGGRNQEDGPPRLRRFHPSYRAARASSPIMSIVRQPVGSASYCSVITQPSAQDESANAPCNQRTAPAITAAIPQRLVIRTVRSHSGSGHHLWVLRSEAATCRHFSAGLTGQPQQSLPLSSLIVIIADLHHQEPPAPRLPASRSRAEEPHWLGAPQPRWGARRWSGTDGRPNHCRGVTGDLGNPGTLAREIFSRPRRAAAHPCTMSAWKSPWNARGRRARSIGSKVAASMR